MEDSISKSQKKMIAAAKRDPFFKRQLLVKEKLNKLIVLHKELYSLIEEALNTNKKDFDITLNDKRFVTSIPFTKEEAKILKKQRKNFIRYVMSVFYKTLVKDQEDPFLILSFFLGANPAHYENKKGKVVKKLSKEEKTKIKQKAAELNKSALAEIEAEKRYRAQNKEYDALFIEDIYGQN